MAARVTESYISQLLTGKKAPPAPERTDIYDRMETFLRLPAGKLATLADLIRMDALKRKLEDPPSPLFKEVRELILRKYASGNAQPIRAMFEREIVLNRRLAPGHPKKFEFVEREPVPPVNEEPGLQAFLQDPSLAGDATAEEIEFLKKLTFTRNRPTPLYYYRELQNLRDP